MRVLGNIDKLAAHLRRAHLALNLAVGRTEGGRWLGV